MSPLLYFFFFNDTATTEIYTLSLHDALPICFPVRRYTRRRWHRVAIRFPGLLPRDKRAEYRSPTGRSQPAHSSGAGRSEEHTSELQSRQYLVCRLLLEKKKQYTESIILITTK